MLARAQRLFLDLVVGVILSVLERPSVQAQITNMVTNECTALLTALEVKQAQETEESPLNGLVTWAYVCATG